MKDEASAWMTHTQADIPRVRFDGAGEIHETFGTPPAPASGGDAPAPEPAAPSVPDGEVDFQAPEPERPDSTPEPPQSQGELATPSPEEANPFYTPLVDELLPNPFAQLESQPQITGMQPQAPEMPQFFAPMSEEEINKRLAYDEEKWNLNPAQEMIRVQRETLKVAEEQRQRMEMQRVAMQNLQNVHSAFQRGRQIVSETIARDPALANPHVRAALREELTKCHLAAMRNPTVADALKNPRLYRDALAEAKRRAGYRSGGTSVATSDNATLSPSTSASSAGGPRRLSRDEVAFCRKHGITEEQYLQNEKAADKGSLGRLL